jgi:hypothetical protein
LLRSAEPRHPAGDVSAAVIADEQHYKQHDRADEADRVGVFVRHAEAKRRAGARDDGCQESDHSCRREPAEERRTELHSAERFLLAIDDIVSRCREFLVGVVVSR